MNALADEAERAIYRNLTPASAYIATTDAGEMRWRAVGSVANQQPDELQKQQRGV